MKEAIENRYQMGMFKEAIKILEEVLNWSKENKTFSFDYARGFEGAIECLNKQNKGFVFGSGEDTPYKIELTKWLEAKQLRANQPAIELLNEWKERPATPEDQESYKKLKEALEQMSAIELAEGLLKVFGYEVPRHMHVYHDCQFSDSPDTDYKITLTKWIEEKQ